MSNKWRTLKELIAELHKYPVRIEGLIKGSGEISKIEFWLCGIDIGGNAIVQQPNRIPLTGIYDEYGWRIYEEPKQPKKWAPAIILHRNGLPFQPGEWFYSEDHVKSEYRTNRVIWPAPGFTPVEIPE